MPRSHESVLVDALPPCDIDAGHPPAGYDAKTKQGPWGYLCEECFTELGLGLGLGIGQRLILRQSAAGEAVER